MPKNNHVHHLLIMGDQKEALRWVPWAKSKLKALQRYDPGFDGNSFGKKKYHKTIGDGFVIVEIKMVNTEKWILIWVNSVPDLYMESGILDHRSIAPLNEDTYLPSILHYSDDIEAIRDPNAELGKLKVQEVSQYKLDGENRGVGDSKALGCPKNKKKREITVSIPTIFSTISSKTFSSEVPKYCADLLLYKYYQDRFPPSMFSGKLRLMIQAIYGSKRRDYSTDLDLPASTATLNFPNGGFSPWSTGNTGLFSGRNYEYFRIRVDRGGIWAMQLTPSEAGKQLRKYLLDNPGIPADRKLRYETYLLSTLYFSEERQEAETKIGDIKDFFDYGGPFGYGVSWNWKGDTGYKAVTRQKAGTTNVWEATLLRVSVSERDLAETVEEGRLVAAVAKEEGPTEYTFRVNEDLIWTPDWFAGGMQLFVTQENAGDAPTHVDSDVPIKTVYNYENDSFDVVRFKREDKGSGGGSFGGFTYSGQALNQLGIGCKDYECKVMSTSDGTIEVGFYVQSVSGVKNSGWEAVNKAGDAVQVGASEAGLTGDPFEVSCPGTPTLSTVCGSPPNANGKNHAGYPAFGGACTLKGDFDFEAMLTVPFYDCDTVYLGSDWGFGGRIDTKHTLPGANVWAGLYLYLDGSPVDGNPYRIGWDIAPSSTPGPSNLCGSGARFLYTRAFNTGRLVTHNETDGNIFSEIIVKRYFNGEFETVHENRVANSLSVVDALYLPSCLNPQGTPLLEAPEWEQGDPNYGGYEFNPVVFPEAENALPVVAKTSANHYAYRATKNPGGNDDTIHDGSYDMDSISKGGDNFLFSFGGFA